MGPSPFSDGRSRHAASTAAACTMLQWGHRLSAMEGIFPLRVVQAVIGLQWGHRLSAMEGNDPGVHFAVCPTSFNGAIAFQRWKARLTENIGFYKSALQWGHRLSAMEGTFSPATPLRPVSSFNGAIAFQRWKEDSHRVHPSAEDEASMGPSPFSDGRQHVRPTPTWLVLLQWGHRLSAMEGDLHLGNRSWGLNRASMGPSPFSDGRAFRGIGAFMRVNTLQWGHRLSAMEGDVQGVHFVASLALQWGHRLSAMEGTPAATIASSGYLTLQWGHRLSAMEGVAGAS